MGFLCFLGFIAFIAWMSRNDGPGPHLKGEECWPPRPDYSDNAWKVWLDNIKDDEP